MPNQQAPSLQVIEQTPSRVVATGSWQIHVLARSQLMSELVNKLRSAARNPAHVWDLSDIEGLDHIGAQLFWNAWGRRRPPTLLLAPIHEEIFARIEQAGTLVLPATPQEHWYSVAVIRRGVRTIVGHGLSFIGLIGQLVLDIGTFIAHPLRGPWKEISSNIFHIGYQALGITALVGFLIGVVLSYLSAQQLHSFGGDVYLVNILGMSVIRELGPLLAAILVAGRSGSAITAQLGVMRVTEELDAMLVMGMPHGFRLIMPRVLALALCMPLLVVWTDAVALAGGMAAAQLELGLSAHYFLQELPNAVPPANYWIGIGKGVVFGSLIALVACHFGLRIKPNTESLGQGTTLSVVTAITVVIVADAVFAILFKGVGFY
ncbi:MlaE family ABC transporter permease [Noviherbaspirillum sp. Root189]|uniref:MlaE family ABC transporter permease n=1 Tax=Noviherbaspirillum sp. Root189 TaxID=1736487 RepID=UPI0007093ABB|nr:ABC transporter permease [Noviherbaspirillum sp. Root189]KRB87919.1 ABC transporter permease [Noviherbaspirillum sp. Root189]